MGRIRMYIHVDNQSDVTLTRTEEWAEEWTPGCFPPDKIGPGQRVMFQSEGKMFLEPVTGTSGHVKYSLPYAEGEVGELYIHWDSPFVEGPYRNTFHIFAPPTFEVTWTGGQGREGELNIRIRRTARRSVPRFNPVVQGFGFSNSTWGDGLPSITLGFLWNRLFESHAGPLAELGIGKVDENWLPITEADAGMCGGMVYAIMDYHHHHQLPPKRSTNPTSADDPVFAHIRTRLWDSFDVGGDGHRYLGYSSPHYPNGDEGVLQQVAGLMYGRSWVTYREEWPRIQADIDAGRLSPLALIQTTDLNVGKNHQVLCHAYEKSGQIVTLFVYDPNKPGHSAGLRFDMHDTAGEVHVTRLLDGKEVKPDPGERIWCIFRTNGYQPKPPPGGQRYQSLREALLAATCGEPPRPASLSVRAAASPPGAHQAISVTGWLRSF